VKGEGRKAMGEEVPHFTSFVSSHQQHLLRLTKTPGGEFVKVHVAGKPARVKIYTVLAGNLSCIDERGDFFAVQIINFQCYFLCAWQRITNRGSPCCKAPGYGICPVLGLKKLKLPPK